MESISRLGYAAEFEPKEKFFIVKDRKIENYSFAVHIILDNGMADLVWIVKKNDKLILGLPIGEFSRIVFSQMTQNEFSACKTAERGDAVTSLSEAAKEPKLLADGNSSKSFDEI